MRVIIAGSRSISDYSKVKEILDEFKTQIRFTSVISGTARGIDKFGEQWATENSISIERHPADWDKWGKAAGYRRNAEMAVVGDVLICIWDGESKGSMQMFNCMVQLKKPAFLFNTKTNELTSKNVPN